MTAEPAITTRTPSLPHLAPVWFLELELTQKCQLQCPSLCYTNAGPTQGHGTMTLADWEHLLDSAPAAGITTVQFIGGEATLHPHFVRLAEHALRVGLHVQVYSNLYQVTAPLWELYSQPHVSLATSYYSDVPAEHDKITGREGSHARTRANIVEAVKNGIPLKVAIVDLGGEGQRAQEARAEMITLGVPQVGPVDRVRAVGRATASMGVESNVGELCGQCGDGRAAVSWDGDVRMCVLSRFLPSAGNVRTTPLADILNSAAWITLLAQVPRQRGSDCNPASDSNDCKPAETICEGNALVLPVLAPPTPHGRRPVNNPDPASPYFLMESWKEPARHLADKVTLPGSPWREPVARTQRHLFVPRWWARRDGEWELRDGNSDPDRWVETAYRDWTLVTRVGDLHADHAKPGTHPQGSPTSSATLPGLVVQMYEHASIDTRSTVLDVGTGTGYGTALLCARLDHPRVTAIDVDPYLTQAAERRLDEIGRRPRLLTADATGPIDWEGERIVATVAVRPIPPSWLLALKTGGRLVTTITGTSLIITANKQEDGGALGRVEWDRAGFMPSRAGDDYPPRDQALLDRASVEEGEHVAPSLYPVLDVEDAWDVATMLELTAPGIRHRFVTGEKSTDRTAILVHPDGSWARAEERDGMVTVHQSGPRKLWSYLDEIRDRWLRHGELPIRGAQVAITPDGVITLRRGGWSTTISR